MVLGWLKGSSKTPSLHKSDKQPEKTPLDEERELQHGLDAVIWIMSDDVDKADRALHEENSSFHMLGRGVVCFMRAVMGFEQDVMKEAADRLLAAENKSWDEMKRAQKHPERYQSKGRLYSAGQEYALCYAESQLMSAVVAVLNESLTESIKGFYKLRKAYVTLDGILAEEDAFVKRHYAAHPEATPSRTATPPERPLLRRKSMPGSFDENEFESEPPSRDVSSADLAGMNGPPPSSAAIPLQKGNSPEESDAEFVDAVSVLPSGTATPSAPVTGADTPSNYLGDNTSNEDFEKKMDALVLDEEMKRSQASSDDEPATLSRQNTIRPSTAKSNAPSMDGPREDFFTNPVDLFIHTGANLCYGLLLLILSMVPPAFSKLLYIIGFKGDRARGIKLLWQATKFDNINGAVAGLVLLGYYNSLLAYCDVVLEQKDGEEDTTAYPKQRCEELIVTMKRRYPESKLWRLEEARAAAGNRDLNTAIQILNTNQNSIMKQVLALNMFERSLCSMDAHEYALCSESFMKCTELNSWSHSLYVFAAAAAETEMYRRLRISDPKRAAVYKTKAEELFRRAPGLAGKKKFMARQLPFDIYVSRKVQKWEDRAKEWKLDLVDCIGVSPLEEMIYLWNGYKRMPMKDLEVSLHNLEWSHATHPKKFISDLEEVGLASLMKATALRNLGKFSEARELLDRDLISKDR